MNTMILKIISIFAVLLVFNFANADESSEFSEKARERRYVGGADESDLKVQKSVAKNPNAKVKTDNNDDSNEGF